MKIIDILSDKQTISFEFFPPRREEGIPDVVEKMKKLNSPIGGEGNGGVILEESHLGRDSLVASVLVLNHLAQSNLPFNEILEDIPCFVMIKDKITLQEDVDFDHIKTLFQNDAVNFIQTDGLKIYWSENIWSLIRPSGTEPIIRLFSESDSQSHLDLVMEKCSKLVTDLINALNS